MTLLDRPIKIHVCKDRTLSYRAVGEPVFNGAALPVYSVDTKEDADRLLVAVGTRQYDEHPLMPGKPWLKFFEGLDTRPVIDLDDLPSIGEKLDEAYQRILNTKVN